MTLSVASYICTLPTAPRDSEFHILKINRTKSQCRNAFLIFKYYLLSEPFKVLYGFQSTKVAVESALLHREKQMRVFCVDIPDPAWFVTVAPVILQL